MHGHTDDPNAELLGDLVESEERRTVADVLSREHDSLTFEELTEAVTREREPVDELRLYHVHLPKLAALGGVEWDREVDTVSLTHEGREALRAVQSVGDGVGTRQPADD